MTFHPARRLIPSPTLALTLALALALAVFTAGCGSTTTTTTTTTTTGDETTSQPPGGLSVSDPWVRATTGTEDPTMSAAFMVIENGTDADVSLVRASTPVSEMVQLHEMVNGDDGHQVMQEAADGVTVRAGKTQLLMPGGYHVMLMGLTQELAPGDEVELTLEFSDGTSLTLTAPVKEFTEEEDDYHSHSASPEAHMSDE